MKLFYQDRDEAVTIYCCDCIIGMKELSDGIVGLIYADPPFYGRAYFEEHRKLEEYLNWTDEWLTECRRIMNNTASIYVHCDQLFSHRIRIIMDEIFGYKNFRNEIIWSYRGGGASKRSFAKKHDSIFFYTKSNNYTFNVQYTPYVTPERSPIPSEVIKKQYFTRRGSDKKHFYHEEGSMLRDVWDIPIINPMSKKRNYPTQKPVALLERIILASSNENDIVLDPFVGSGTSACVSKKLSRMFIGYDINKEACLKTVNRCKQLALL